MGRYASIVLLICALAAALVSLFGDDSYSRIVALQSTLDAQKAKNVELEGYVKDLRARVKGLRSDGRFLEKAARNELGLARPDEIVVFFEPSQSD